VPLLFDPCARSESRSIQSVAVFRSKSNQPWLVRLISLADARVAGIEKRLSKGVSITATIETPIA